MRKRRNVLNNRLFYQTVPRQDHEILHSRYTDQPWALATDNGHHNDKCMRMQLDEYQYQKCHHAKNESDIPDSSWASCAEALQSVWPSLWPPS